MRIDERVTDMEKMLQRLLGPPVRSSRDRRDLAAIMADPPARAGRPESRREQPRCDAAGGTVTIETRNVRLTSRTRWGRPAVPPGSYVMLAVSDTGSA